MIVRFCDAPAVCDELPVMTRRLAVPTVPVAVNVIGEPESEPDVAVRVLVPAVAPRVQAGEVAIPDVLVVTDPEDASEPPPDATAKVTGCR